MQEEHLLEKFRRMREKSDSVVTAKTVLNRNPCYIPMSNRSDNLSLV